MAIFFISLPMPNFETKISSNAELASRVAALPKPVVMTNGVFDILHRGHVSYLAQARELGASLVVLLIPMLPSNAWARAMTGR